ncbi:CerR family C-terminal domain-containing protein [Maridesulfovibrio salexigens]|uniref:Transcriptional regulator, TetR family n=1 Tax=Maridesulfovibrio salexigens (strain ATCC 14822 / DSM 2638 / NCIMB 8403 / VKM B-1763) TaxID=526222 RepID=C6BZI6_MARSD|nr:CerR family C-terminal domain-containing protein [Maridesulfovibrio salexigens]ACS80823.1 transcriptional regulator, TetR family [Maridesulfovibrio salexigens DSM 2638]
MTQHPKGKTNKARGEETRQKLIEVGLRLFAMNGFNGVSMRNLASEAEVNLATVGYHFGGKQGLYEAVIREIIRFRDEIMPSLSAVQEQTDRFKSGEISKEELVAWFFRSQMLGVLSDPITIWGIMLINREMAAPSEVYPLLDKEFFEPSIESMNIVLQAALPEGASNTEIMTVGTALIGIVLKFVKSKAFTDRVGWDEMTPERIEEILEILSRRVVAFICC